MEGIGPIIEFLDKARLEAKCSVRGFCNKAILKGTGTGPIKGFCNKAILTKLLGKCPVTVFRAKLD